MGTSATRAQTPEWQQGIGKCVNLAEGISKTRGRVHSPEQQHQHRESISCALDRLVDRGAPEEQQLVESNR